MVAPPAAVPRTVPVGQPFCPFPSTVCTRAEAAVSWTDSGTTASGALEGLAPESASRRTAERATRLRRICPAPLSTRWPARPAEGGQGRGRGQGGTGLTHRRISRAPDEQPEPGGHPAPAGWPSWCQQQEIAQPLCPRIARSWLSSPPLSCPCGPYLPARSPRPVGQPRTCSRDDQPAAAWPSAASLPDSDPSTQLY